MQLSKRQLTRLLHGKLLPDQVDRHSGYASTRRIIRTELAKHLASTRKKQTNRETLADIMNCTHEYALGEKIAYAAYCLFMQKLNITPKPYTGWRVGNGVLNATTDLRRSSKSRWLQIRDQKITIDSIVTRNTDPKILLKVIGIGPDCMVIVSHPNKTSTFSITPGCLVKITDPARHPLFNTIA